MWQHHVITWWMVGGARPLRWRSVLLVRSNNFHFGNTQTLPLFLFKRKIIFNFTCSYCWRIELESVRFTRKESRFGLLRGRRHQQTNNTAENTGKSACVAHELAELQGQNTLFCEHIQAIFAKPVALCDMTCWWWKTCSTVLPLFGCVCAFFTGPWFLAYFVGRKVHWTHDWNMLFWL